MIGVSYYSNASLDTEIEGSPWLASSGHVFTGVHGPGSGLGSLKADRRSAHAPPVLVVPGFSEDHLAGKIDSSGQRTTLALVNRQIGCQ